MAQQVGVAVAAVVLSGHCLTVGQWGINEKTEAVARHYRARAQRRPKGPLVALAPVPIAGQSADGYDVPPQDHPNALSACPPSRRIIP